MATWTTTVSAAYLEAVSVFKGNFPLAHRHEDCTAAGALVSPTTSAGGTGVLDLYPQYGDVFLYVRCTGAAIRCGSGTLAGSAGNGYYTASQNEWVQIPVWSVGRTNGKVRVITAVAAQTVEFFFDTMAI